MRAADKDFIDFSLGLTGSVATFIAGLMLQTAYIPRSAFGSTDFAFAIFNVHMAGWLLMAGSALILVKCCLKHMLTTTPS